MLTAAGCAARRERLWNALPDTVEWVVVADPQHLVYLADYWQSPFVFNSVNASGMLLLGRRGPSILFADNLCEEFARSAHVDERSLHVWYESKGSAVHRRGALVGRVVERLQKERPARLGLEFSQVPYGIAQGLGGAGLEPALVDLDGILRELRRAKDPDELEVIRTSVTAGEAGFRAALEQVRPGMTEIEVFQLVRRVSNDAIGMPAEVYGDFTAGPATVGGGGAPTLRKIEPGDLFILDFSVVVRGYRADFCNTFAVGRPPTDEQRRLYDACLSAIEAGEKALEVGRPARSVDQAVRGRLQELGLAQYFPHHTGHGLGLGHPDPPYLVPESTDTLAPRDVVTIEPGLYIPSLGGVRYERNYFLTSSGPETLTNHGLILEQPAK